MVNNNFVLLKFEFEAIKLQKLFTVFSFYPSSKFSSNPPRSPLFAFEPPGES